MITELGVPCGYESFFSPLEIGSLADEPFWGDASWFYSLSENYTKLCPGIVVVQILSVPYLLDFKEVPYSRTIEFYMKYMGYDISNLPIAKDETENIRWNKKREKDVLEKIDSLKPAYTFMAGEITEDTSGLESFLQEIEPQSLALV
jgi:hypothetical protein